MARAAKRTADVVVIGAGSVGAPLAYFLSRGGARVAVVDRHASPGRGQNRAAIGGVRATHSDPAKIRLCLDSIDIFSTWREEHGDEIGWKRGGYCFPAFREREETILKGLLPVQKEQGLEIDWVGPSRVSELIPGIVQEGLRGGTYSPGDGQVSPLRAVNAFCRAAEKRGATFHFRERVTAVKSSRGRIRSIATDRGEIHAPVVVNAAGAEAREVGALSNIEVPVTPDSHEAGITAPVAQFLAPLVVDIRPGDEGRTSNFYFGQNSEGQIIFCYTPSELFVGTNSESTSEFMPVLARRMIALVPRLKNLVVRRVWRGLYPMTPDGTIILDKVRELEGLYLAAGMCGQGFMLGPGVGRCMASLILDGEPTLDPEVFSTLSFYRDFHARKEALK
jgi:sarcosine oxidase subunit beta